jgi:small subunit ribosomal protein S20
MAHTRSAKKRIRQIEKRTARNRARTSRIRTFTRKVEQALTSGNYEAARAAFEAAEPEIRRGVTRGVLHRNTASRKISRLARRVNALAAGAAAPEGARAAP